MHFLGVSVTDGNGKSNYPIDFNKEVVLHADIGYSGESPVPKVWSNATIAVYGCLFGKGAWTTIPTFGLLCVWEIEKGKEGIRFFRGHLTQCNNCPIQKGKSIFVFKVDAQLFAPIIALLGSDVRLKYANENAAFSRRNLSRSL